MNTNRCNEAFGCTYSKSMDQDFPRKCIKCGHPELNSVDQERISVRNTRKFELIDVGQLLTWIHHRNEYISAKNTYCDSSGNEVNFDYDYAMIEECNKNIKKILQLN